MTGWLTRTHADVVAEIAMTRTAYSGTLLIVEGSSDVKFWRGRIAATLCDLIIAGSKDTVLRTLPRSEALRISGILGVVDDDYDSILGVPLPSNHIIPVDTRDIETLLLRSAALDRILLELCDQDKRAAIERVEQLRIRDILIAKSLIFGKLRFISKSQNLGIDFKKLSPYRFIDEMQWTVDEDSLLRETARQLGGIAVEALRLQVQAVPQVDPWVILHGKDTLAVLAVGLRSTIGNEQWSVEHLSRMLRLAFDDKMFASTRLHTDIRQWEADNQPFVVLDPKAGAAV